MESSSSSTTSCHNVIQKHPLLHAPASLSITAEIVFWLLAKHLSVAVLGLDVVGKGLGLLNLRRVVVVIILRTDVLHLVDTAALGASLDRTLLGKLFKYVSLCLAPLHLATCAAE